MLPNRWTCFKGLKALTNCGCDFIRYGWLTWNLVQVYTNATWCISKWRRAFSWWLVLPISDLTSPEHLFNVVARDADHRSTCDVLLRGVPSKRTHILLQLYLCLSIRRKHMHAIHPPRCRNQWWSVIQNPQPSGPNRFPLQPTILQVAIRIFGAHTVLCNAIESDESFVHTNVFSQFEHCLHMVEVTERYVGSLSVYRCSGIHRRIWYQMLPSGCGIILLVQKIPVSRYIKIQKKRKWRYDANCNYACVECTYNGKPTDWRKRHRSCRKSFRLSARNSGCGKDRSKDIGASILSCAGADVLDASIAGGYRLLFNRTQALEVL